MNRVDQYAPAMLSVLRIVAALLFMQHGLQKLFKFPDAGHHPGPFDLFSLAGVGGMLETFGGLLLLVGLWTRPVAFLLSGQMAVAYFLFHLAGGLDKPRGFFPVINGGDLAILFCFLFLYIVAAGPGPFSLDARRQSRVQKVKVAS